MACRQFACRTRMREISREQLPRPLEMDAVHWSGRLSQSCAVMLGCGGGGATVGGAAESGMSELLLWALTLHHPQRVQRSPLVQPLLALLGLPGLACWLPGGWATGPAWEPHPRRRCRLTAGHQQLQQRPVWPCRSLGQAAGSPQEPVPPCSSQ